MQWIRSGRERKRVLAAAHKAAREELLTSLKPAELDVLEDSNIDLLAE